MITETGVELRLRAVRMVAMQVALAELERRWREKGEPIDAPTFEIKTVAGVVEEHELSEEMVSSADDWDTKEEYRRNKARWLEHLDACERLEEAKAEQQVRVYIALGVDVDMPTDDMWERELTYIGLTVPGEDDPVGRKFYYVWHVATSPFDKGILQAQLSLLAAGKMVTEEDLDRFQDIVRSSVEKPARAHIKEALQEFERDLVASAEAMGDGSGGSDSEDPE